MKITVDLDEPLITQASAATGIKNKSDLVNEALRQMVQREAAKRLIELGGSDPKAEAAARKRYFSKSK